MPETSSRKVFSILSNLIALHRTLDRAPLTIRNSTNISFLSVITARQSQSSSISVRASLLVIVLGAHTRFVVSSIHRRRSRNFALVHSTISKERVRYKKNLQINKKTRGKMRNIRYAYTCIENVSLYKPIAILDEILL